MVESGNSRDIAYDVSDVLYKPPLERRRFRFGGEGARTVTIELRDEGLRTLAGSGFIVEKAFRGRSLHCFRVAERVCSELAARDEMTPLVLEGLVLDLFGETHRLRKSSRDSRVPVWLERVREQIQAEFARPWRLADYARQADVHPAHLAARFRECFHCSIGDYIREQRIREAMRKLAESEKPIADIALDVGFSDQSHLTRAFRKRAGTTPAKFRRSRRRR